MFEFDFAWKINISFYDLHNKKKKVFFRLPREFPLVFHFSLSASSVEKWKNFLLENLGEMREKKWWNSRSRLNKERENLLNFFNLRLSWLRIVWSERLERWQWSSPETEEDKRKL